MEQNLSKRVGIKDIARVAGVSIGTVDRVLHNRSGVKKETLDHVTSVVKELGYKPNVIARSLASKKTTRIAVVIPDSGENNPYWEKPVLGIQRAAEALANYNLEITFGFFEASNQAAYTEALEKVCNDCPDGVVLNPVFKSISNHYISIFDKKGIPYVFMDVNIKGVGKLAFFGQDAEQSGKVVAKLMAATVSPQSKILIVKQSDRKIFSQHIESRIQGFNDYLSDLSGEKGYQVLVEEIDLLEPGEPDTTLSVIFNENPEIKGVFIPNSRGFKVAAFIQKNISDKPIMIGYDLVRENISYLKNGTFTCLISQKPEEQAYKSVMALFDHLVLQKEVPETVYSPIDIIVKENIDYYI